MSVSMASTMFTRGLLEAPSLQKSHPFHLLVLIFPDRVVSYLFETVVKVTPENEGIYDCTAIVRYLNSTMKLFHHF
jgi:hypothetical protein